jgi:hypothetical protein
MRRSARRRQRNHGGYPLYRCPPTGDCPKRVNISAALVEGLVTDTV